MNDEWMNIISVLTFLTEAAKLCFMLLSDGFVISVLFIISRVEYSGVMVTASDLPLREFADFSPCHSTLMQCNNFGQNVHSHVPPNGILRYWPKGSDAVQLVG